MTDMENVNSGIRHGLFNGAVTTTFVVLFHMRDFCICLFFWLGVGGVHLENGDITLWLYLI